MKNANQNSNKDISKTVWKTAGFIYSHATSFYRNEVLNTKLPVLLHKYTYHRVKLILHQESQKVCLLMEMLWLPFRY